jgi:hypothetical protein
VSRARAAAGQPRREEGRPLLPRHDGFAVIQVGPAGNGHPHPIDLQPVQPLDDGLDGPVILPAEQPVGRRASEEVMLTGAFPYKVPVILRIDPDRAAAAAVSYVEGAR